MKDKIFRALRYALYASMAVLILYQLSRRASSGPSVGTVAGAFALPVASDTNSTAPEVRLADYRGKPVLLEVFASWCGACRRSAPTLVEAWQAHRKSGVEFLGISIDDAETARRVKRDWDIPYPIAIDDGSVARNYSVKVLPTFVLIDREGKVRRVSTGVPSREKIDKWLSDI